jgi:hypothetical protein
MALTVFASMATSCRSIEFASRLRLLVVTESQAMVDPRFSFTRRIIELTIFTSYDLSYVL